VFDLPKLFQDYFVPEPRIQERRRRSISQSLTWRPQPGTKPLAVPKHLFSPDHYLGDLEDMLSGQQFKSLDMERPVDLKVLMVQRKNPVQFEFFP
jgi:hypothetical protein